MEITPANAHDIEYLTDEQVYRFSSIAALRRLGFPRHGNALKMYRDEIADVDEIVLNVRKEGALMMQERAALGGPPALNLEPRLNAVQITQILIHGFGAARVFNRATSRYVTFMYDFRYGSFYVHDFDAVKELVDNELGGCMQVGDAFLYVLNARFPKVHDVHDLPEGESLLQNVILHEFSPHQPTDEEDDDEEWEEQDEVDQLLNLLDGEEPTQPQLELALHPNDEAFIEELNLDYFEEDDAEER